MILQYKLDKKLDQWIEVDQHKSQSEASIKTKMSSSTISRSINSRTDNVHFGGEKYRFVDDENIGNLTHEWIRTNGKGDVLTNSRFIKYDQNLIFSKLLDSIKNKVKPVKYNIKKSKKINDLLLTINDYDRHLGINDTDEEIKAFKGFLTEQLVEIRGNNPSKTIYAIGGDFFHFDNHNKTTTAGTQMESDSTLNYLYEQAANVFIGFLENAGKQNKIEVHIVPGNHDRTVTSIFATHLKMLLKNHKNIEIFPAKENVECKIKWGSSLIVYRHGDNLPKSNISTIIAHYNKEINKDGRVYLNTGHYHSSKEEQISAGTHFQHPSTARISGYEFRKGYLDNDRFSINLWYNKYRMIKEERIYV